MLVGKGNYYVSTAGPSPLDYDHDARRPVAPESSRRAHDHVEDRQDEDSFRLFMLNCYLVPAAVTWLVPTFWGCRSAATRARDIGQLAKSHDLVIFQEAWGNGSTQLCEVLDEPSEFSRAHARRGGTPDPLELARFPDPLEHAIDGALASSRTTPASAIALDSEEEECGGAGEDVGAAGTSSSYYWRCGGRSSSCRKRCCMPGSSSYHPPSHGYPARNRPSRLSFLNSAKGYFLGTGGLMVAWRRRQFPPPDVSVVLSEEELSPTSGQEGALSQERSLVARWPETVPTPSAPGGCGFRLVADGFRPFSSSVPFAYQGLGWTLLMLEPRNPPPRGGASSSAGGPSAGPRASPARGLLVFNLHWNVLLRETHAFQSQLDETVDFLVSILEELCRPPLATLLLQRGLSLRQGDVACLLAGDFNIDPLLDPGVYGNILTLNGRGRARDFWLSSPGGSESIVDLTAEGAPVEEHNRRGWTLVNRDAERRTGNSMFYVWNYNGRTDMVFAVDCVRVSGVEVSFPRLECDNLALVSQPYGEELSDHYGVSGTVRWAAK